MVYKLQPVSYSGIMFIEFATVVLTERMCYWTF